MTSQAELLPKLVPKDRLGREIGMLEISWPIAFLVWFPILGEIIELYGWNEPHILLTVVGEVFFFFFFALRSWLRCVRVCGRGVCALIIFIFIFNFLPSKLFPLKKKKKKKVSLVSWVSGSSRMSTTKPIL